MTRKISFSFLVLSVLALALGASAWNAQARPLAAPQAGTGPGFTYQGQLTRNGNPFTGNCDFTFGLWDSASGGTKLNNNDQTFPGLSITNGLFTVVLNDSNQFGANPFDGGPRYLEVSVTCAGDAGPTVLGRQQLTHTPYASYAMSAGNVGGVVPVANGGTGSSTQNFVDLSNDQAVGGVKTFNTPPNFATGLGLFHRAPFTVTASSNLMVNNLNADLLDNSHAGNATNNVALNNGALNTNLNADMMDGQHAHDLPPEGSWVLGYPGDSRLTDAGWLARGASNVVCGGCDGYPGTWSIPLLSYDAPAKRWLQTAIWTGNEMIVWGGYGSANGGGYSWLNNGGRFNPATNTWALMANGSISGRQSHTAVWTGNEMIAWGGCSGYCDTYKSDGALYNPATDTWSPMSASPLLGRGDHTAVWTGKEMIIWGGCTSGRCSTYMNDGVLYNPSNDTWTTMAASPLSGRWHHTAIWTGSEMIVWGGVGGMGNLNDGARYNPATNTWTMLPASGASSARQNHTAVWTGTEMIIWGGNGNGGYLNNGGRFNPTTNTWTALLNSGAPSARQYHTAVWTGSEMIVWGGVDGAGTFLNDGGRYDPNGSPGAWTTLSATSAPSARQRHTAIWTGSEMIVWGGSGTTNGFGSLDDGGRYNLFLSLFQKP